LITVDSRNAGEGHRWSAFCPLLEPVTPAKFIQLSVLIPHLSPFTKSQRTY